MTTLEIARLREAYQSALDIQDACNLSGLVRALADYTYLLWEEARELNKGSDYVNKHPVVLWYVEKFHQLAGRPSLDDLIKAHAIIQAKLVELRAEPEHVDPTLTREEKT